MVLTRIVRQVFFPKDFALQEHVPTTARISLLTIMCSLVLVRPLDHARQKSQPPSLGVEGLTTT
jgi:hypothetical protein